MQPSLLRTLPEDLHKLFRHSSPPDRNGRQRLKPKDWGSKILRVSNPTQTNVAFGASVLIPTMLRMSRKRKWQKTEPASDERISTPRSNLSGPSQSLVVYN